MATSNNLGFDYVEQAQSQKEVTVNAALSLVDAILNKGIVDRDLTTPPGSPAEGDLYIPAATATGAWVGNEGKIAYYLNGAWGFITPNEGLTLWVSDEDVLIAYDGSSWVSPPLQNVSLLGVNTTADTTNKLSVASSAVLIDNVGNGTQVKLNKAAAGDTNSFLFQTGFSGRAEIGCIGNDDFTFKVSPDNFSTSYTAFTIDKDTGLVNFPQGFSTVNLVTKSFSFPGNGLNLGTYYSGGFYIAPVTDANLTQASATVVLGTANIGYAANAFIVAGAAGSASGGSGAVEIEVSGTSVSDAGVRTASDTEIIVADITALIANQYVQTSKRWIGQVTFTLQNASGSTQTTFSADFNYGFAKYEHFGNAQFTVKNFEFNGYASANDSGFNVRLLKHSSTGWVYHATAFTPGGTELTNYQTEYNTEYQLSNGQYFGYDRHSGIDEVVDGSAGQGVLIELTTGTNNSVQMNDLIISVTI